jgi:hypothetical protein
VGRHSDGFNLNGLRLGAKEFDYFVLPLHGLKSMSRVSLEKSWQFIIAGVVMLGIGGLLLFSLISRP